MLQDIDEGALFDCIASVPVSAKQVTKLLEQDDPVAYAKRKASRFSLSGAASKLAERFKFPTTT